MRRFAASFQTEESAVHALEELDRRFGDSARMGLAPLGHAGPGGGGGARMVLAGTFQDDVIAAVRLVVSELGGSMVVDTEHND